jgi:seryl-tRNA synthetase
LAAARVNTEYSAGAFYKGLIEHNLIVPVGVRGAFARCAVFEEVLHRFDALVTLISRDDGSDVYTFPPVINRQVLEKVRYFDAFPHLCGSVYSFFGTESQAKELSERIHDEKPWDELLGMTDVVLNPAACYPLYPTLTGTLPEDGRRVTMLNWVFRHEPSSEPTRMQHFRVREFVSMGTSDQVLRWREVWLERGMSLLQSLGLDAKSHVASDPFFGSGAESLAASQKARQLKFELSVPVISEKHPTALCSFNFHQAFFGLAFDIRTHDERIANSACVGFGLERIVMALFQTHGFEIGGWPLAVRSRLWP